MRMNGFVTDKIEARMNTQMLDFEGGAHEHQVIIDTGFTGSLTLPRIVIERMGFEFFDYSKFVLADSQIVDVAVYRGKILWHGVPRETLIHCTDGDSLLGMTLLHQNRMTMDAIVDGPVTIDSLPIQ